MFLSTKPTSPDLRSLPFLWVRNGAVVLFLAIAALVVFPPNPALAFWSIADSTWRPELDAFATHVELYLADESNIVSQNHFDSFNSQMRYNQLYRESELVVSQSDKNIFAEYIDNPDLFNEPLRDYGTFGSGSEISDYNVAQLDSGLAKSGSYRGVAYRIGKTTSNYIDELAVNDLYTDTAFSSSSINFETEYKNARGLTAIDGKPKVIYKRVLKSGKVLSDFPDGATANDSQIVSRPNTVFKVRGIAKIQSRYGEVTVVLEEEKEEGGLLKINEESLSETKLSFSGENYHASNGGRKAKSRYEEVYNEDGTEKVRTETAPCTISSSQPNQYVV